MSRSSEPPTKITKRQSKSCKRCLRRKQRCHGFPVCRACEEAAQPCEQSEYALQLHSHDSSHAAFKRIQTLETQLASALEELAAARQAQQQHQRPVMPYAADNFPGHHDGRLQIPLLFGEGLASPQDATDDYTARSADDENTLIESAGAAPVSNAVLPFEGGDAEGGASVGLPGHGLPPRESTVEQMVQATVWAKGLLSVCDGVSPPSALSAIPGHGHRSRSTLPLEDAMGCRMIEAYFDRIHPRYPFLDRVELFDLHRRRQDSVPPTLTNRFNAFKLNMVYAIGGTLLKLTDPLSEAQAEGFHATALRDVSSVQEVQTLQTVEGLILLVIYNLRSPTNTGIWYLINLAMQTCIDLGLHLEASYANAPLLQSHKMRRLFWSVYVLDRFIALSFKRPFSIAEHDIETRIPPDTEVYMGDQQTGSMEAAAIATGTQHNPHAKSTFWTRFIQIKRLESRIQAEAYCLGDTREQCWSKVGPLLTSLDAWNRSLPPLPEAESIYLQLQLNGAVAQLLRPFLNMMRSDNPLIVRCLKASGNVCAIFKRMHQRDAYGHSFVSAHLTFITGVTMCYCIFLAPHLFDNGVANNLRACSSAMFIIAERYHRLRKHRDILEDIIGRIIDSRMNASSLRHGDADNSQGQQFSQLDFIAVQSLLNLAAQQEPQEMSRFHTEQQQQQQQPETGESPGPPPTTALPASYQSIYPASFLPVQRPETEETEEMEEAAWRPAIMSSSNYGQYRRRMNHKKANMGLPEQALDFNSTGSWDVDRYSLEMLGRMIAPD